jgi:DNA invertase Pin-like site-specific DNA recombinase
MRLDGYIRVSRVGKREGPSFISPDLQRQRIEGLAAAGGHEVVRWHTDLDESGTKAERPGFVEALTRVDRGETEGIAVAKLDRFARSVADCAAAVKRIQTADGVLLSAHESIDTSGAFGRFVLNVMSAMAELEVERIRENWEAAREAAVARGVHISSKVPTGYRRGEDGRLEVVDGVPISEVFRRKADGASWRELGKLLEDAGVRTPYGAERWQAGSLRRLIANRVYLGEARSGEFILRGAHPALLSEAEWQAAQFIGVKSANVFGGALLSGLLRCAGCGYILKADTMRDRKGAKRRLYRCRDHATGQCTGRASVLGSVVEPWVVDRFFAEFPSLQASAIESSKEIAAAEGRVVETERELVLYRDTPITDIGQELWAEGMQARARALENAHRELGEARGTAASAEMPTAAELRRMWRDLTLADQREVLSGSIDAVFIRQCGRHNAPVAERAIVLWAGTAPDDLPGPGKRSRIRPFAWPDGDEVK